MADRGVMAAPPYGRVGGVAPTPGGEVGAPGTQNSPGMPPRAPKPGRAPQRLWADRRAGTAADFSLCPSPGPSAAGQGPSPSTLFLTATLFPRTATGGWAQPASFRLRWRNVPGTRRDDRTGVGLCDRWKEEVGHKSFDILL